MLDWLFNRTPVPRTQHEEVPPFQYGNALTLLWDVDSEGWTCAVYEWGEEAHFHVGSQERLPKDESCELVLQIRSELTSLTEAALAYLLKEASQFVRETYRHSATLDSFRPASIEIFEHYGPGTFALCFDPVFDEGAVWSVHFEQRQPVSWGFDD